jgi:hypothetical protein
MATETASWTLTTWAVAEVGAWSTVTWSTTTTTWDIAKDEAKVETGSTGTETWSTND